MAAVTEDQLPGTTAGSKCGPAMTTHGPMQQQGHQWTIASGAPPVSTQFLDTHRF